MLTLNFYDDANIFVRSKNLLGAGLVVVNLRKSKLFDYFTPFNFYR